VRYLSKPRFLQHQIFHKYLLRVFATIICASAILLGSFYELPSVAKIRGSLRDSIAPAMQFFQILSQSCTQFVREGGEFFTSFKKLKQLQTENDELRKWEHTALALISENKALRKQVKALATTVTVPILTARLLTFPSPMSRQRVIIQGGKRDGIVVGQPVMTSEGLLGRIIEVGRKTSEVLLITDEQSRVPVILEPSHQQAILAGHEGKHLTLQHLEKETVVEAGARVLTSGKGGIFPPGLYIGNVKPHNSELVVHPACDWKNIEYVQVLVQLEDEFGE
jgi:rod shape-determining protein MreC